jgi:hypothetical protein
MKKLILITLLVIFLASPAMANYSHEMSIVIEGEYTLTTNVAIPDAVQTIDVEGIGSVRIETKLKKVETSWWDLF